MTLGLLTQSSARFGPVVALVRRLQQATLWSAIVGLSLACTATAVEDFMGLVVPLGHVNIVLTETGDPRPLYFSRDRVGVCLESNPGQDVSQWRLEPTMENIEVPQHNVVRVPKEAGFVCFEWLPADVASLEPLGSNESLGVCARLSDDFDGRSWRIPCWQIAYRPHDTSDVQLEEEWNALLGRVGAMNSAELLEGLFEFRKKVDAKKLVLQGVQAELVAAHFLSLEGTPEAIAEARRRLDELPLWLDQPEASYIGGLTAYQRARLELDEGDLSEAWRFLELAAVRFRRIADTTRLSVETQQARILAVMGSPREAARLLRLALELGPGDVPSQLDNWGLDEDAAAVVEAGNQLAWVTLLDPEAGARELQLAKELLAWALGQEGLPLERANIWINSAYLQVRLGESPSGLEEAKRLLDGVELGSERSALLRSWISLVEGLNHLRLGELSAALTSCSPLTSDEEEQVAGWALSCMAQAREQQGQLEVAEALYEQSILRQQFGSKEALGRGLELGPSQPAVDTARLARVALLRSAPDVAWQRMLGLDQVSRQEGDRKQCRAAAGRGTPEFDRWQQLDHESQEILNQLKLNARRASWQDELATADRELRERLQTLWREWPGCEVRTIRSDSGVDYRAFWLDGEIFLLHRDPAHGAVQLVRRTPVSAEQLTQIEELLDLVLDPRNPVSDEEWRTRLAPVSRALVPDPRSGVGDDLPPDVGGSPLVLTYALHGRLQRIPLAGLVERNGSYLAERVVVALHPAGAKASAEPLSANRPLFVVDPERNLRGSKRQEAFYAGLFEDATILAGEEASRSAFQAAIGQASWFHADAHARHDDAFPELSFLSLSDGPLHWVELAETEVDLEFANLSSCESGRWPTTADSGSFGLGGLLSRLGARWVVASRGKLDNQVAIDFNGVFYAAIAEGDSLAEAYRLALSELRRTVPASQWSSLILLRSAAG